MSDEVCPVCGSLPHTCECDYSEEIEHLRRLLKQEVEDHIETQGKLVDVVARFQHLMPQEEVDEVLGD